MLTVKHLSNIDINDAAALEKAFESIASNKVACVNWPAEYGYAPEFSFKIFHTGDALAIRYEVREKCTAALVEKDNGEVWTDSCCEFFFQPGGKGNYYNLEATCIGKVLLANRSGREDVVHAEPSVLSAIGRFPSLGCATFAEKKGDMRWSLLLTVPAQAYFKDDIKSFCGLKGRFNIYKCGDRLSMPHFVSYAPIKTESPDFHRPEYFTEIEFEG